MSIRLKLLRKKLGVTLEALADVDAGRLIEHRAIVAWADSLGSDEPLQPPPCVEGGAGMKRGAGLVVSLLGWAVLAWLAWALLQWGVINAEWRPDEQACRLAEHGACWGVVPAKAWPLLLGHYPEAAQWRPITVIGLSVAMLGVWLMSPARHRLRLWWADRF